MTQPTHNDMPYQALAHARGGLQTFEQRYGQGIQDIDYIFDRLMELGHTDDCAAMLAVAVYQVNAPEPEETP